MACPKIKSEFLTSVVSKNQRYDIMTEFLTSGVPKNQRWDVFCLKESVEGAEERRRMCRTSL